MGSPSMRAARWDSQRSDGGSAQCASSTAISSGPLAARLAISQYRPWVVACGLPISAVVTSPPPKTRRAFELHKLEGLTQEETARELGVSRKTVEKQISAALQRLLAKLNEDSS